MTLLSHSIVTRWAVGDGGLASPGGASMDEAAALAAMPEIGVHEVQLDGESFAVERVGSRYCSVADVRDHAKRNNDGFADEGKYSDNAILAAIQDAEEAIEDGTKRSFCQRARTVRLDGTGVVEELPEVDVRSITHGTLLGDRQAVASAPGEAVMVYGAACPGRIRRACIALASSYLRPRAGAENARGQSVDGVYISYELATGDDGSWTGIPTVDAAIESCRSRRVVVA